MMTRGTRGDVQPFVALAIGMCNQYGWLVTICTELVWREFVHSKCAGVTRGLVRFLPCGGDTTLQTSGWLAQQAMSSKTEVMQTIMMAASESNFFVSAPVFVHQMEMLLRSPHPPDLIISSFTLTGISLLVSERCSVPVAGFCLQPTCIPSKDADWHNVIPIDSHGGGLLDILEAQFFTCHSTLQSLKTALESNPLSNLNLQKLRSQFGLEYEQTWETVFKHKIPMVIPMKEGTFRQPADWKRSGNIIMTDFIFLRSGKQGGGELAPDLRKFVQTAQESGRKLAVMTFSSMPVRRAVMLKSATKMAAECKFPISLVYVGKKMPDQVPKELERVTEQLKAEGKLMETERADFGVLFQHMDCFIVHGGLGTTVEALRLRKPTAVTGILLMDQRFWGHVCEEKGVGPAPTHIDEFETTCVDFVNKALDEHSSWTKNAATLNMGKEGDDGVAVNVECFANIVCAAF